VSVSEVASRAVAELTELARMVGADRVVIGRRGNLARSLSRELAAQIGR
jgi:hypothetical protein